MQSQCEGIECADRYTFRIKSGSHSLTGIQPIATVGLCRLQCICQQLNLSVGCILFSYSLFFHVYVVSMYISFECDHAVSVFALSFYSTIIILGHLCHLVILG